MKDKVNENNHEKGAPPPEPKMCPGLGVDCIHEKCALWVKMQFQTGSPLAPQILQTGAVEGCFVKVGMMLLQLIVNSGILEAVKRR